MTPDALSNLAHNIAEAAAKCVGADASQTHHDAANADVFTGTTAHAVSLTAGAGAWRAHAAAYGHAGDALDAAAALALRDRVMAQREERARMLAADDAALRVIDETARIYDAATVAEALHSLGLDGVAKRSAMCVESTAGEAPWPRVSVEQWASVWPRGADVLDACDAILRRRAGTP